LALGNPYGLGGSVTKGILSSKNRRPATGNEPLKMENWLQTDAAINPGNSGGPLVNLRGELIGLNVAVYREEQGQRGVGVGFSIPVKQVSVALSRFLTPEVLDSLWFGAQFRAGQAPLVVTSVQPGSPAAKAGLNENDEILQVNGQSFSGFIGFNRLLTASTNHEARLLYKHGDDRHTASVRLLPFEELIQQKLGLTLLDPQTSSRSGNSSNEGLYVEGVEKEGPADKAQLRRGFFVVGIDGHGTTDLLDIVQVISAKKKGDQVQLTVVAPRRFGPAVVELRRGTVDLTLR
jgi:S1-C subfamily serine protease